MPRGISDLQKSLIDEHRLQVINIRAGIAETKVAQVMDFSRQHQHPLQCTLEKE